MEKTRKLSSLQQFVGFVLDKELYAVDVMKVSGVERIKETTVIPGMPDFLEGVINLRDEIIPIVDLRKRFNMASREHDKETRTILIELDNGLVIGMIVDSVKEVFQLEPDAIGNVPRVGKPKMDIKFIRGVARKDDKLIIVLDVESVLSEEETEELKTIK